MHIDFCCIVTGVKNNISLSSFYELDVGGTRSIINWVILYIVLQPVENYDFTLYGKLTCQPTAVSWMPAEDMRLLGQRCRSLLLTAIALARVSAFSFTALVPQNPILSVIWGKQGDTCTCSELHYWEEPWIYRTWIFYMSVNIPALCSRGSLFFIF